MKRLFDENDKWTDDANRLSEEVYKNLKDTLSSFYKEGFSTRDMEYVVFHTISLELCAELLRQQKITTGE